MKSIFLLLIFGLFALLPSVNGQLSDATGLKQHFVIEAGGQDFDVEVISNFNVEDIEINEEEKRLTLNIESSLENNIGEIIIPKNLINGNFTFYLDEQEIFPKVQENDKISFITTEFEGRGTHTLDVMGTTFLPEFEGIALIILGSSLFGILLVGRLRKNIFIHSFIKD